MTWGDAPDAHWLWWLRGMGPFSEGYHGAGCLALAPENDNRELARTAENTAMLLWTRPRRPVEWWSERI